MQIPCVKEREKKEASRLVSSESTMTSTVVPISEREELQVVRDLSSVWENPQLQQTKPVLSSGAARPLLHYCARKILEIRKRHNVSADEFPLTGRADDVLFNELTTGKLDDVNQFVTKLIRAALQTHDGNFIHDINDYELNNIINNDPPVFSSERALSIARTLSDKIDQLLEDMIPLNHTLEEYSNLDVICRKLRNVEFRCFETMKMRQEELREKLRISGATPAAAAPAGAQPAGVPLLGAQMGGPGITPVMTPQPTSVPGMEVQRDKSQQANRYEVEKVRSHVLETMSPIQEMRRTLSLFGPSESLAKRRKLMKSMRKRGRDFHEELMNLLFSLDELKIFDETDRLFRRDTIDKVQDMLDELDSITAHMDHVAMQAAREAVQAQAKAAQPLAAQPQVQPQAQPQAQPQVQQPATQPAAIPGEGGMAGGGEKPIEELPTRIEAQAKGPEKEKTTEMAEAMPTDVTKIDWHNLKLPIRFDSRVTQQAYLLLASIANLDLKTLKLTVAAHEESLRVEGFKAPTENDKKQLEQTGDVFKALANAQGRFGTFKEEFQLPKDVQTSEIYAEYNRGILRVVIPRNVASRPVESFFGVPGEFFEGDFWW